ncbi:G4 quadruplex nucleic acid binding protein, partial [Coemansia sp. RSA 2673]
LADLIAFANVHAFMVSLSSQKRLNWCDFSRWFDLVQHTVPAGALAKAGLKLVEIDLNAPALAKKPVAAAANVKDLQKQANAEPKQAKQAKKEKRPAAAATKEEFKIVPSLIDLRFVEPPKGSKPGDRVYFEGYEDGVPEEVLKPKQKVFETIQPGLFTDDNREAGWYDENKRFHKLLVSGQVCTTATVAKGSL